MARSDNGDDSLWKEIGEEVHKDTDRLFKMIGEAYAMLSDPAKVLHISIMQSTIPAHSFNGSTFSYCCEPDNLFFPLKLGKTFALKYFLLLARQSLSYSKNRGIASIRVSVCCSPVSYTIYDAAPVLNDFK